MAALLAATASLDAKPGAGGNTLLGDVVVGEYLFSSGDATPIVSTCPSPAGNTWSLDFAHTLCLIVRCDWRSIFYPPYDLTDDVKLITLKENGKNGRITHIRLLAQDVYGEAGIQHNTDWIPVAYPVVPDRNGGTLHVRAPNVQVWRTDGHTGGTRVDMIGLISIGDINYHY